MMSTAVLVSEHCTPCGRHTDHEVETFDQVDPTSECQECRHVVKVSPHYAQSVAEALEG